MIYTYINELDLVVPQCRECPEAGPVEGMRDVYGEAVIIQTDDGIEGIPDQGTGAVDGLFGEDAGLVESEACHHAGLVHCVARHHLTAVKSQLGHEAGACYGVLGQVLCHLNRLQSSKALADLDRNLVHFIVAEGPSCNLGRYDISGSDI